MKTQIVIKETNEIVGNPNLDIIPRINEKIFHNDVLYSVIDVVHSQEKISFLVKPLDTDTTELDVIWN